MSMNLLLARAISKWWPVHNLPSEIRKKAPAALAKPQPEDYAWVHDKKPSVVAIKPVVFSSKFCGSVAFLQQSPRATASVPRNAGI